jgi:ABC-2 type transport system ATP-binding protein
LVIETEGLTKSYGRKTGCSDVTISVRNGEIFGFLGPNGAGKSTFVKMLTGLLFPTSGKALIFGRPIGDVKTRFSLGYLPENFRYQEWMTGVDLLSFHASLCKMGRKESRIRIEEVLRLVNLNGQENYKIGTYSKGMQQRIGIASALLHDPGLLILDEPTSALDPIGRKEVRDILQGLKRSGKTIFLNSHLLGEVETLCDSVAFINKGIILKQGKMDDILNRVITLDIHVGGLNDIINTRLKEFDENTVFNGDRIRMNIQRRQDIPEIAAAIVENGGKLYELAPHGENLEDLFISLIEGGGNL